MDFSLSELRAFCTVAEAGNISGGARALGVTQPSLSWSIKKMEANLGVALFYRGKKGVTLTRAGHTLLARSRELMRSWDNLRDVLREDETEVRGAYTLGVHGTIATYTLPLFYPPLLTRFPHVELRLEHNLSRHIAEAVINHRLDFGIVVEPPTHPDLTITPLYTDAFRFWVHREMTEFQLSCEQGLVMCNPALMRTETLMREAERQGLIQNVKILHTTELELVANMVSHKAGVGVLPATVVSGRTGDEIVPVEHFPCVEDTVCLVYRREVITSRAAQEIKSAILTTLRDEHPLGIVK